MVAELLLHGDGLVLLLEAEVLVQGRADLERGRGGRRHVGNGHGPRHLGVGLGGDAAGQAGVHGGQVRVHPWLLVIRVAHVQARVGLRGPGEGLLLGGQHLRGLGGFHVNRLAVTLEKDHTKGTACNFIRASSQRQPTAAHKYRPHYLQPALCHCHQTPVYLGTIVGGKISTG